MALHVPRSGLPAACRPWGAQGLSPGARPISSATSPPPVPAHLGLAGARQRHQPGWLPAPGSAEQPRLVSGAVLSTAAICTCAAVTSCSLHGAVGWDAELG